MCSTASPSSNNITSKNSDYLELMWEPSNQLQLHHSDFLLRGIIYKDSPDFTTQEGSHSSLSLKQVFNENK